MSRLGQLILFAGVWVFISGVNTQDARPADSLGPGLEKKTLTRVEDFVLVQGKILKKNLGRDIGQMGLLAFHEEKPVPIPFQIDERNPDGDWVLTQVPPELKNTGLKPERDDDNGLLDGNDELAFMARDAGDRIGKEYYPPGILAADEIMIRDPKRITENTRAVDALRFMESHQISQIPVVDNSGKVVGMLRLLDLVRAGL